MKEIRFRIWNSFAGVMESWEDIVSKNKIHLLSNQLTQYPVMQFTGLQDKNDVDIYEGDIINITYWSKPTLEEVKYDEDIGFTPLQEPCNHDEVYLSKRHIEVVGNIYEDPNLIKAS